LVAAGVVLGVLSAMLAIWMLFVASGSSSGKAEGRSAEDARFDHKVGTAGIEPATSRV
jgi:hypothetical protein